jgi:hypothetical protein
MDAGYGFSSSGDLVTLSINLFSFEKFDGCNKHGDFGYLARFASILRGYGYEVASTLC